MPATKLFAGMARSYKLVLPKIMLCEKHNS